MEHIIYFKTLIDAEGFFESLGKVPVKLVAQEGPERYRVEWTEEKDYVY